jgi:hypothetical protein
VAQIGLLMIAFGLLLGGLRPLLGMEKGKKTHPAVAVAMLVIAVALALFAVVVLPRL